MLRTRASFADFWLNLDRETSKKFKVEIPTVEEIMHDLSQLRSAIFDDQTLTEEERMAR